MTDNQRQYLALQESIRHNAATERQAAESLKETARSNLANEGLKADSHAETVRSNQAREFENFRSNFAKESETHRANVARETETIRDNTVDHSLRRTANEIAHMRLNEDRRHNQAIEGVQIGHLANETINTGNSMFDRILRLVDNIVD